LWLGPLLVLLAGGTGVAFYLRRRRDSTLPAFTADEQARLDRLLREDAA